jgi:hypothetical protein
MKQFEWALVIRGSSVDLEDAVRLFGEEQTDPSIHMITPRDGESPITVLTSSQMDDLARHDQVHEVANRLLGLVNGALFVLDAVREPLTGYQLRKREADGKWGHYLFAEAATFHVRDRDRIPSAQVNAGGGPTRPAPALRWVAAAQSDQIIADVLTYLRDEPDWFALYKAFEVMRKDISRRMEGQHRQDRIKWPKKRGLDHFTLSAQVYRHAPPWKGGYTPEKAMSLVEAREFLQSLASIWLAWRLP